METSSARITIEDVRTALGDADPNATNAGALRQRLGRGSLSTLQKHLDTLRQERAAVLPAHAAADLPPVPGELQDLAKLVWATAYRSAEGGALALLSQAKAKEDALLAQLDAATADRDEALAQLEKTEEAIEKSRADLDQAQQAKADAEAARDLAQREADQIKAEKDAQAKAHADEVALLKATQEATMSAMRGELDRLVNQLADFRLALGQGQKGK